MWGIAATAGVTASAAALMSLQGIDLPVKVEQVNLSSVGVMTLAGWALVHWLKRHFATRDELNGWGERMKKVEEGVASGITMTQEALHRSEHAKTEIMRQAEHIEKHLIEPIRQLSRTIGDIREQQAAQTQINRQVDQTLQEIRDALRGGNK